MVDCPNCHKELPAATLVAKLACESRVHMKMTPSPGEMFDAETVADSLSAFSKLLKASAQSQGVPVEVLLEKVTHADDGSIDCAVLVARHEAADAIRQRRKAQADSKGEK